MYTTGMVPAGFRGDLSPYSAVMPGMTKASAVGFMMSIVTATAIVSSRETWVQEIRASSSALTRIFEASAWLVAAERGYKPYKLAKSPTPMAAIPINIGVPIGMPARR